jgi:hypothetical protein
MKNIKDIMAILRCNDEQRAFAVFTRMGINGTDFSECTKRQFKRDAIRALEELNQEDMQRAML